MKDLNENFEKESQEVRLTNIFFYRNIKISEKKAIILLTVINKNMLSSIYSTFSWFFNHFQLCLKIMSYSFNCSLITLLQECSLLFIDFYYHQLFLSIEFFETFKPKVKYESKKDVVWYSCLIYNLHFLLLLLLLFAKQG